MGGHSWPSLSKGTTHKPASPLGMHPPLEDMETAHHIGRDKSSYPSELQESVDLGGHLWPSLAKGDNPKNPPIPFGYAPTRKIWRLPTISEGILSSYPSEFVGVDLVHWTD